MWLVCWFWSIPGDSLLTLSLCDLGSLLAGVKGLGIERRKANPALPLSDQEP